MAKLTKGSLSLGQVEKRAMQDVKSNLDSSNEKRTTIYIDQDLYRIIKHDAVKHDQSLKEYINDMFREVLTKRELLK
ncbi:TPA: hypothetical protein RNY16_002185 [Pasteurella multocida]|nr:hypothetical protein [Pasteurella multocida]